ncbi:MAG: hypothetical protein M3Q60_22935 [Actinomycetota bacterium]|nr:hypothetical protein [Actinomycetota bacterium]
MSQAEGTSKITVFVMRSASSSEGDAEYVYEAAAELQQTRANASLVAYSDDSAEHALGELELCLRDLGIVDESQRIDWEIAYDESGELGGAG